MRIIVFKGKFSRSSLVNVVLYLLGELTRKIGTHSRTELRQIIKQLHLEFVYLFSWSIHLGAKQSRFGSLKQSFFSIFCKVALGRLSG